MLFNKLLRTAASGAFLARAQDHHLFSPLLTFFGLALECRLLRVSGTELRRFALEKGLELDALGGWFFLGFAGLGSLGPELWEWIF